MSAEQPAKRHATLEQARERVQRELATENGTSRELLQQELKEIDRQLREIELDQYNQSSMDADSEA